MSIESYNKAIDYCLLVKLSCEVVQHCCRLSGLNLGLVSSISGLDVALPGRAAALLPVLRLARETEALGNLLMLFASTSED